VNARIIRQVELWLGRPLCAALTLHRRVADAFWPRAPHRPQRIALIKLIEQGSAVLTHAAVRRVIDLVGRSNVYWCTFEENREIVDILDFIPPDNVIAIRTGNPYHLVVDAARAVLRMRRLGIEATVDLEFFARAPAILAYLTGARCRVGLHRFDSEAPYRGDLMTHRVQYNPYLHTAVTFDLLARALDADPAELPMLKQMPGERIGQPPRIQVSDADREAVGDLLRNEAGKDVDGPIVVLNPNAHDRLPLRKWPNERFVEIGRRILTDMSGATIVITGTAAERSAAEQVRRQIGSTRVLNLAGRMTLRQAIVLHSLARAVLTNDSGPAHFASLTDTTIIVLFGPETPALYGPLGPNVEPLWAGIACSPCVNVLNHRISPCTNNVCMQELSVDLVYARLAKRLGLTEGNSA
jgi:ADP-heptose:LPS heptosyltransferase